MALIRKTKSEKNLVLHPPLIGVLPSAVSLLTALLGALLVSLLALLPPADNLWPTPRSAHASSLLQSVEQPLVLAFYYAWYDENTWSYDKLSDLPAETYASRDRAVMGRHIDLARNAGIDGFLAAWYGPDGATNQTEANLSALLEEATNRNFRIGILFETNSPFLGGTGAIAGALQHALAIHAAQPAYLRVDGRPVIFFWRPGLYGVDTWRSLRVQVDPGYASLWINEGVDTSYLTVFDGHYLYSNTWNPPSDLNYTNQKFAARVEAARQNYGGTKLWVATVMPGYDDSRIRPGAGFRIEREDGAYYQRSWSAAIASQPNWVVITSFNEWPEGTYIEPSAAYGARYMELTAAWATQFKNGAAPDSAAIEAASPKIELQPLATPAPPTPTVPTAIVVSANGLNLRSGPGSQYDILTVLVNGLALPITGQDTLYPDWWQVQAGDQTGWISATYAQTAGPMQQVEAVSFSPPPPTPTPIAQTISGSMPPPVDVDLWINKLFYWR
jgi:hypothetical protein